nr:protein-glutamate O-methyltransferase CheR [Desulfobulbaceae bacterium]
MKKITDEEVKVFSRYIYEISGIVLDKSKGYLLETRLRPLMRDTNAETFSDFFYQVKADPSDRLKHKIIDAISTNETFFFRDSTPFDLLRNKILPDLIDRRRQQYKSAPIPLRIWSAACSTGQEVYSIAITLKEVLHNLNAYNISILGSDISDKVIAQASYGKYSRFEMERGLPSQYLHKYFNQIGNEWRIKDEIRAMAQFNKMNLLHPFPAIGAFDIIFCRNVAIYFSQPDRQKLFNKISNVMEPDGILLLGGSESLSSMGFAFESNTYLRGIFYQKKGWEKRVPPSPVSVTPAGRPAIPPLKRAAPKPKPATVPTTPAPVKQPAPGPVPVVSPPPPPAKPATPLRETGVVPEAREKTTPGQAFPSPPPPAAAGKKAIRKPQSHDPAEPRQKQQPKKSLLSTLQRKKSAGTSQYTGGKTDFAAPETGKEAKSSLLDRIANRQNDKKNNEKGER